METAQGMSKIDVPTGKKREGKKKKQESQNSPCRKRSPAKGVWQKSDEKSDRSIRKSDRKVTESVPKTKKSDRTPFDALLKTPPPKKNKRSHKANRTQSRGVIWPLSRLIRHDVVKHEPPNSHPRPPTRQNPRNFWDQQEASVT